MKIFCWQAKMSVRNATDRNYVTQVYSMLLSFAELIIC